MAGKKYPVAIGKGATVDAVALFSEFDHKKLKISKSYYNKLKRNLKEGKPLSGPVTEKLKKLGKGRKHLRLQNNTPVKVNLSASTHKALKARKYKITATGKRVSIKYAWVKFKLSSRGNIYYQSVAIPIKSKAAMDKQINDYINSAIKQYDDYPVFIMAIQVEAI